MHGVRVWSSSLEKPPQEVEALYTLLCPVERARAEKFYNERDRRRFVLARGTLRTLLGEHLGVAPESVAISVQPGGKPTLSTSSFVDSVFFNVSHCGDLALFAIADCEIGIDVERLNQTSDIGRVAAHFFAAEESAEFERLEGVERTRFFYRTWVRKEAYLKATGSGLTIDPARVRVQIGEIVVEDENGAQCFDTGYAVHDIGGIDEHAAAIVVRRAS